MVYYLVPGGGFRYKDTDRDQKGKFSQNLGGDRWKGKKKKLRRVEAHLQATLYRSSILIGEQQGKMHG